MYDDGRKWPETVEAKPGRVNVYTCPVCNAETVTIDIHVGVTPFALHRPWAKHSTGCPQVLSYSSFYRPREGHGPPTLEWYAPGEEEARQASRAMYEHAWQGGLFLRSITPTG